MGLRGRIRRLEREGSGKVALRCPERSCHEVFVVYGKDPQVEFLSYWWQSEYRDSPKEPPEDIRRLFEHEHDPSLFVNERGEPWLGTLLAGLRELYETETPDLSEQTQD